MRTTTRLATAALALSLVFLPTAAAGEPAGPDTAQAGALDISRQYDHVGPVTEAEHIHRQRLSAGPKGPAQEKLGEEARYVVPEPATDVPMAGIEPVSFDECVANHQSVTDPFWFKNKYNSCRAAEAEIKYYDLVQGQWVYTGSSYFDYSFIGVAQDRDNKILFGARLLHVRDVGDVDKFSTTLTLQLGCLNTDPRRASSCSHSGGPVTKSVGQWQIDGSQNPVWFTTTATTSAVPADDEHPTEKRGYFSFDLVFTSVGENAVPHTSFTPPEYFRCDEATYVRGSKCVFTHVTSTFTLLANDPEYKESSQFIRDAQTDITLTKPGLTGKKVPGRLKEEPLHRLYHAYDRQQDIPGSRRKVRRTCRLHFGVGYTRSTAGVVQQCDEYPFATTRENAARVDESTVYSFAVKAIAASHNQKAGNIYGNWLSDDHILDGDPFYVVIQ